MAYPQLRKQYYGDEAEYKKAYSDRYNSPESIKIDFDVKGRQAFFVQCDDVTRRMYSILRLDKKVSELCRSLPGIAWRQYSYKCLIDEIVVSNNIEGVHSSRKEIGQVLSRLGEQSRQQEKYLRFTGMVDKYFRLTKHEEIPLQNCRDIRTLYDEIVLQEVVAEDEDNRPDGKLFRKDQTTVRSATDKIIHAGLTPERRIIEAMEKALAFLHDESVEMLYRICLFHYMIEYIHPFYDGNGRLGRFIVSYCISNTLEPLLAFRLSEVIKKHIREYYQAFEDCNDPHNLGDLTPFLLMMLDMIESALKDLRDSLERKKISLERYYRAAGCIAGLEQKHMELYQVLIQASLFGELGISTQELKDVLHISYATLKKQLSLFEQAGLLLTQREGKAKFYSLDTEKLDAMRMQL